MPYVECINISNVNEKMVEKLYMCISPERQKKKQEDTKKLVIVLAVLLVRL